MRAPTTICTHLDLADYKRFIRNHIIQMQEKTIMDTKEKIVGIFSIMIQVFRLPHAGACGGRTIPSLKKHIMRREIRYIDPEKNNQNLCFFLAYSFITMPDIKAEVAADSSAIAAKCFKEHSRITESKRLFQRIYGKKIDDNYNGFNFATEADQFIQNENLNINVCAYEETTATSTTTNSGSYYLWKQYRRNEQNEQTKDFNVLLITDTINEIQTAQVFYINDVEALTGLKYCPICGVQLDKSEPFPQEAFRNSIRNKNISTIKYHNYLAVAQQISNRWDYLRHYNIVDTRFMMEPVDYLIDIFFNYKIDMLQFMSMSACANAIKHAVVYWDFKLDQDYTPKDDYASFILNQNYWNIKVQNYLEQDKKRNRDTSNNIKESD
ncbi:MAG: hypothetical protein EZS28_001377 [Streblomastix strix]|uniref:Uncharacterized protein n=1 Tax=Streblomastix strix TaxID=222440 RepID=A0A5J4X9B2_9EUKA|nr:MAG: hypothetical protein EZS28_001377 [Streblomastix strix]